MYDHDDGSALLGGEFRGKPDHLLAVREVHLEYHAPARYDDRIEVITTLTRMGKLRIDFQSCFHRPDDDTAIADGSVTVFCIDRDDKVCRIPEDVRQLVHP